MILPSFVFFGVLVLFYTIFLLISTFSKKVSQNVLTFPMLYGIFKKVSERENKKERRKRIEQGF